MKNKHTIEPNTIGKRRDKPAGIAEKVINLLKIINFIERGDCPSIKRLAEEAEVSDRSIYRYLNIINFIVPIVYDRHKGGYRFERTDTLKVIPFKDRELALLAALADVTTQIGEPMKETFSGILSKINSVAKDNSLEDKSSINIMLHKTPTKGLTWIEKLTDAIIHRKQIHITYNAINTQTQTKRTINPYKLSFNEGLWFVYGYCNLRKDNRWFAIDRIENLQILDKSFDRPDNAEIQERLRDSWGIREGERAEVVVRFVPEVAELINRKPSWHSSEQRNILDTGETELIFTVSGTEEIKWWIYSWIPYVKVIKPESFREEIKKDITRFMADMTETTA